MTTSTLDVALAAYRARRLALLSAAVEDEGHRRLIHARRLRRAAETLREVMESERATAHPGELS